MRSYPTALVLEDDPTQLPKLSEALTEECNLDVVQARSAVEAQRRLQQRQNTPVLAIIDWDMRLSPDRSLSVPDLLRWLREFERGCYTIVYTIQPETLEINNAATLADPLVHFQSKTLGTDALIKRVKAITGVAVGDLVLAGDAITSTATAQHYFHEVARRLMSAYPHELDLSRDAKLWKVAYRFGHWLEQQESNVRVDCTGSRRFRLIVTDPGPRPE